MRKGRTKEVKCDLYSEGYFDLKTPLGSCTTFLEFIRILSCSGSEIENGFIGTGVYSWLKMRVKVLLKGLAVYRGKLPSGKTMIEQMFVCETLLLTKILAEIECI